MGLPARQRRVLDRIENSLEGADPRLATMFAIFGRLTHDEEMPRIEELRHRLAIMFLRIRLWMATRRRLRVGLRLHARTPVHAHAGRRVPRRPRPRRPAALLFPIALLMATATIVLVARFGGSPRCSTTTTAAAAKPFPGGTPDQKNQKNQKNQQARPKCAPVYNPLFTGR